MEYNTTIGVDVSDKTSKICVMAKLLVGRTTTLALDFSDLGKPFGTIGAKRK